MIKVIIGHRVKQGADIQPILLKLRSNAMQYPGYVSAENLVGEKDSSIVLVISTWQNVENWKAWERSKIRAELYRQAEALLKEEPKVTVYRVVPVQRWV
ncbi:MAG: antibiotic biosynthesis monooxygenase [Chloroflexi bacterium]|nr:MAG: antibiotic biosynthesis monooxygenase [Chloroflexota bacterium]